MIARLAFLLCTLLLVGCGRPSPVGHYETQGSEKQFKMTLDLRDDGRGVLSVTANLGRPELNQSVVTKMALPSATWSQENTEIVLSGTSTDQKKQIHRFTLQENRDLIWKENGARFYRSR